MAVWFGGVRLPPEKIVRFLDELSGSFALFTPAEPGSIKLTLQVCGRSGAPALTGDKLLAPYSEFDEVDDGAVLSVKPMPLPQPSLPEATKEDILVALIGFDSNRQQVFEVGHDGMRTHREMKVVFK